MLSQTTSSIQKKLLKEGEKQKSSSSSKSCRICTCSFAWGVLARLLSTYLRKIYSEGFTWCGTHQLQWVWSQLNCLMENLCSITCFGVLHPKSLMLPSKNYLAFRLSNQPKHVVLCWQNNERNPKLFHLFVLSGCFWVQNNETFVAFVFSFAIVIHVYQTFLKASQQNCNIIQLK